MPKVYCCNCKYYREHFKEDFCEKSKTINPSAIRLEYIYLSCEHVNKNNDCPNYKRKWWKFWVKDK